MTAPIHPSRHAALVRQWRLLIALDQSSAGLTFAQIANVGDCHERTARRDVDTLTLVGFPIDVRTPKDGAPTRVYLHRASWQQRGDGTIFNRQGH